MNRFSVVIPTCRRNSSLAECLEKLAPGAQLLPEGASYEVIVTDDGGEAQALIAQQFPWATWVKGPGRGPASNRNNGANHATSNWLVFLDDDCLPDAGLLSAYSNAIALDPSILALEGRIYTDRPRKSLSETAPLNGDGGYLWACNFAVQKALFQSMGGFDERFPFASMEDVEFCYRLKKKSISTPFVKEAAVCHPWRKRNASREVQMHEISLGIYLKIHPEQSPNFSPQQLLFNNLRCLIKETLPGLIRFRGAGCFQALAWHFFSFGTAIRAFTRDTVPTDLNR